MAIKAKNRCNEEKKMEKHPNSKRTSSVFHDDPPRSMSSSRAGFKLVGALPMYCHIVACLENM